MQRYSRALECRGRPVLGPPAVVVVVAATAMILAAEVVVGRPFLSTRLRGGRSPRLWRSKTPQLPRRAAARVQWHGGGADSCPACWPLCRKQ